MGLIFTYLLLPGIINFQDIIHRHTIPEINLLLISQVNLLICTLKFQLKNGENYWILQIFQIFAVNTYLYFTIICDKSIFHMSNFVVTMCGYFGTVLSLLYEPEIVDEIVDYLLNAFDLGEDIEATCLQEFIPEMRLILNQSEILLTSDEFFKLEGNTIGTVIKLLYAFLWQVSSAI